MIMNIFPNSGLDPVTNLTSPKMKEIKRVRCRVSAWLLTALSVFWTGLSLLALSWLRSVRNGSSMGPMEWLCLSMIAIHVALILATLWVWWHPRPEVLVLDSGARPDRRFASAVLIGLSALWLSRRLHGRLSSLAEAVGPVALCVALLLALRDIAADQKLANRPN